jgi:hypothetical protein
MSEINIITWNVNGLKALVMSPLPADEHSGTGPGGKGLVVRLDLRDAGRAGTVEDGRQRGGQGFGLLVLRWGLPEEDGAEDGV